MWDSVAYEIMGDENQINALMAANQKYLNYYAFPAGIVLNIPENPIVLNSNSPPWKKIPG